MSSKQLFSLFVRDDKSSFIVIHNSSLSLWHLIWIYPKFYFKYRWRCYWEWEQVWYCVCEASDRGASQTDPGSYKFTIRTKHTKRTNYTENANERMHDTRNEQTIYETIARYTNERIIGAYPYIIQWPMILVL